MDGGRPIVPTNKERREPPVPVRVKTALLALWDDPTLDLAGAAKLAGIRLNNLRAAMVQGHVRRWAWHARRALVEACAAGNPVALKSIRDNVDGNQMARVAAAKTLEGMRQELDEPGSLSRQTPQAAGITIVIEPQSTVKIAQTLDHESRIPAPADPLAEFREVGPYE